MIVHLPSNLCLLCVLTLLLPPGHRCHEKNNHTHPAQRPGGVTLEEEQHFYIQQLFRRYGSRDRLDFQGFQSLLLSLGLGEVKLVEVDHEELGHDHVAHLDVLDVQDGAHSHAATHDGHGHHKHEHGHHKHEHGGRTQTDQAPTQCTTLTTQSRGHEHGGKEEPHHGHGHEHQHGHHHGHDVAQNRRLEAEDGANVQKGAKDAIDLEHDHHEHDAHKHDAHKHDAHKHDDRVHDEGQSGVDSQSSDGAALEHDSAQSVGKDAPEEDRKHLQDLPSSKSQDLGPDLHALDRESAGGQHSSTAPPAVVEQRRRKGKGQKGRGRGQTGEEGARSRREAVAGLSTPTAPAPIGPPHPEGSAHQHEECLNLTQLLTDFGLSPDSLISPVQFSFLCPALLYQIDSRLCIRHYHQVEVESQALEPPSSVWVWVWGFVSITIISLLSLLGVILVPILDQSCFKFLLTFLVALAVGTLSGDALLHLLPHAQGQHDHSAPQDAASDLGTEFDGVWKGLTALAGIYLLFIIEHCLGMYKHYKDHKSKQDADDGGIGRKLSDHKLNRRSDAEWLNLKALPEDADSSAACDNGLSDTQLTEVQTPDSPSTRTDAPSSPAPAPSPKKNGHKGHGHSHGHKGHGHGHSHGGNCHSDQDMKDAGVASIAWMVIMGDGMHNFSDGLAIGAAFSANLTGGISTSVAVFCHELPHELGDFAVLLKAGMSVKQAIVYNVLSALMAYVGMIIGTTVGQYTHNLTSWIFAITAGMFLYVALVDMLPEMLHGDSEDHKRCQVGHFLLQNVGLLSGFSIMLLIAIFEDQIVFDFGF